MSSNFFEIKCRSREPKLTTVDYYKIGQHLETVAS